MENKRKSRLFLYIFIAAIILIVAVNCQRIFQTIVPDIGKSPVPVQTASLTHISVPTALSLPTILPTNAPTITPSVIPESKKIAFVATTGDDSSDGSNEHPWKTIQFAVDHILPGGVIFVREGSYSEAVHITKSGELGEPILLSVYDSDHVTIDGGDSSAITGEGAFWMVKGFILESAADRVVRLDSHNWTIQSNTIHGAVYLWGDHNVIVDNEIDGSKHLGNENGFMEDGPFSFGNVIKQNRIHDFTDRGIWSQWFTHESLIEKNTVYNINGRTGICIDLDGASSVGYLYIIRGNIVHDCGQTGIELENSYSTLVENNLVYKTGLEAIQVVNYPGCQPGGDKNQFGKADGECRGDDLNTTIQQNILYDSGRVGGIVSYESSGVKVYNNTVFGGESVALFIKSPAVLSDNWDVRGNIFSNHARAEISVSDPSSLSQDGYNLIDPVDPTHTYEVRGTELQYYSLSEWQNNIHLGAYSFYNTPGFVDPLHFDFHLLPGSAAIDSGIDLGITLDFDGILRPQFNGFDIGAYEYAIKN